MSGAEWRAYLREIAGKTSPRLIAEKFSGTRREIKPGEAVETFVAATKPARAA